MQYLLRTHENVFLVKARNYNEACHIGRCNGIADQDKGIELLGGFADNPVGDVFPLNSTGVVITSPDLLKKAIQKYVQACLNESWKGAGDPADWPLIDRDLAEAQALLKDVTGLDFTT